MPFDPRQLAAVIGGAGPQGNAFLRGFQRGQQEIQARKQQEQQAQMQQHQMGLQQQQVGMQRERLDLDRAAGDRAGEAQRLQMINSVRGLLEDPTVMDPAMFDQRLAFVSQMAPTLEPGFLNSLRPAPTVFQQRRAKAKLVEIEKAYSPQQLAMLEMDDQTGAAPVFEVDGERLTIGQLRARAGVGALAQDGQPASLAPKAKPDVPNTPEEQFYQRYASERNAKTFGELPTTEQAAARKQWMQADDRPLASQQQMGGLPTPIARRANQIADAFKAEPMVRSTTTVAEAYSFVSSLSDTSTNPADDQALIYAFAKAQDPESVVREGEYQTVQKYSQSWLDNFKFNALRVLNNQEFLTPEARKNMKKVIQQRYLSRRQQYDNIRAQYAKQINRVTGQQDGEDYLVDYAGAFPTDGVVTPPPAAPAGGGRAADPLGIR